MRASQVLHQTFRRFSPSRLGAIPLFIGTLFLLRWSMGESPIPERPMLLVGGAIYLTAFYAFSPWGWQWTGNDRHRTGIFRGCIQALLWNLCWLGILAILHQYHKGPEPQHLAQGMSDLAKRSQLPLPAMRLMVQLPFAILVGWFVAEKEASDLDRIESEGILRQMEEQDRNSRMQALLAQLDPHVLYNALGALTELVREDPVKAETALMDLSDLYRELTRLRDEPWISLASERRILENYLAIESLRLGNRLQVEWNWPEELNALLLPPLLILPLVENALKHGIAPVREGGRLQLEALREIGGGMWIRIRNTGSPLVLDQIPQGTGLRNLRARLQLLDGKALACGEKLDSPTCLHFGRRCQGFSKKASSKPPVLVQAQTHSSNLALHTQGEWTVAELYLHPQLIQEPS